MPEAIQWPRDTTGAPLHFLAQICCADLPKQLWGGKGPRTGWLLLFVETLKLEDYSAPGTVAVLHIDVLGPERQPPEDMPYVRHAMRYFVDYAEANIREGFEPLWRKWPVDIVAHNYELDEEDDEALFQGAPVLSAEELYNAPVKTDSMGSLGLERPLTWRGGLYVVERVLDYLEPKGFKSNFIGNWGGLLEPPESDINAFNAEFARRAKAMDEASDTKINWSSLGTARPKLEAEIRAERCAGYLARGLPLVEKAIEENRARVQLEEANLAKAEAEGDENAVFSLRQTLEYFQNKLAGEIKNKAHLEDLIARYPGADGEERLNAEIKASGLAHLEWGARLRKKVQALRADILEKDLSSEMPKDAWTKIADAITSDKSRFWQQTYSTRIMHIGEQGLGISHYVKNAAREDLLDLYAQGPDSQKAIPEGVIGPLEEHLRFVDHDLTHRIGGHPNHVQYDSGDPNLALVFQLASDDALGWSWGGGAVYVGVKPSELKRGKFRKAEAWIECG